TYAAIGDKECSASSSLSKSLAEVLENPERPLTGLSVVVIKNGKIAYTGNFGKRLIDQDKQRNSLKVDSKTKFRVASLSKLETATGIMQLVEQKKIDLDEDVS